MDVQRKRPVAVGVAMKAAGAAWLWVEAAGLLMRMKPGEVPDRVLGTPPKAVIEFIESAIAAKATGPKVPVVRGPNAAICGVRVSAELLADIEERHEGVAWRSHDGWLLGHVDEQFVAAWMLPKGHHIVNVVMVNFDGEVWGVEARLAFRLEEAIAAKIREAGLSERHPAITDGLRSVIQAAAGAPVVQVGPPDDGITRVGPCAARSEHVALIRGKYGEAVEWRCAGQMEPAVAFLAGKAIGVVTPIALVTAPGGSA